MPDRTGERARTIERLQAACNTNNRLGNRGRTRLQDVEFGLAPPSLASEPPSLTMLSDGERSEYAAVLADTAEFQRQGLSSPERRAEYVAAAAAAAAAEEPGAAGERARKLERLQTAFRTYQRMRSRGLARLQAVERNLASRLAAREKPPWRRFLDKRERAELSAARPGANQNRQLGLAEL